MIDQLSTLAKRARAKVRRYLATGAPQLSYSQAGEDLVAGFVMNALGIDRPTYLDIGAYHPKHLSNTYHFYRQGGRGVCIEPDPWLFKRYKKSRPRDICVNAGIGTGGEGVADFYVMSTKTLNTFSEIEARKCEEFGHRIEAILPVPLIDINTVIKEHFNERAPNFVSIDVEGLDFQILQSLNLSDRRPEILCVETITYSETASEVKVAEIAPYMESHGYMTYADTYINTIFVDAAKWRQR